MKFPQKLDVLTVHAMLITETGGTSGLRDEALLESALAAAEIGITTNLLMRSGVRRRTLIT
jgi:prophage maintenance system killer protein